MATTEKKVVYVVDRRCSYTRKGENLDVIRHKALIYKKILKKYKRLRVSLKGTRKPNQDDIASTFKLADFTKKEDKSFSKAWDEVIAMFSHKDQSRYHNLMIDKKLNLRKCSDIDLGKAISDYVAKRAKKKSYIKLFTTGTRNVFRAIGREYAYGDGEMIRYNKGDFEQRDLVHTGNPMTSKLQDDLLSELKERAKVSGYNINSEHHSAAVSLPVVVCLIVKLVSQAGAFMKKTKIPDSKVMNRIFLTLMYSILIHEGGTRLAETADQLTYNDLFLVGHKRIPFLVLPFLSPLTLQWLLSNNAFKSYVTRLYKGKQKREWFMRMKSVIPYPFNIVDLPTLFTIAIKCILWTKSTLPCLNCIFPRKKRQQLVAINSRFIKSTKFTELSFYSTRYAAAEEDKKTGVDVMWTRRRMGHTDNSQMPRKYAHGNERSKYNGVEMQLGVDVHDAFIKSPNTIITTTANNTNTQKTIKLEMNPVAEQGVVYDNEWLTKVFKGREELQKDFEDTLKMVNEALATGSGYSRLFAKFSREHRTLDDLKMPIGCNIALPEAQTTTELRDEFDDDLELFKNMFCMSSSPTDGITVEISSFPHIVYGNWRSLIGEQHRDKIIRSPSLSPSPSPPISRSMSLDDDGANLNAYGWDIDKVSPKNFVVMLAAADMESDMCCFKFHDMYIWVAMFEKWGNINREADEYELHGKFFYNEKKDLNKPLKLKPASEPITISKDSILEIYEGKKLNKLTKKNLESIKQKIV